MYELFELEATSVALAALPPTAPSRAGAALPGSNGTHLPRGVNSFVSVCHLERKPDV